MSQAVAITRNGVDTEQLFGTLDAIKADPSLGRFQFRAHNHWIDGSHNHSKIRDFYGAGQEDTTRAGSSPSTPGSPRSCSAPTPARTRPSTCCTRSPPASRPRSSTSPRRASVKLTEVESTVEGDMDVRGASASPTRSATASRASASTSRSRATRTPERLQEVVERAKRRSAVFDMVSNGVPVEVGVVTA